MDKKWPFGPQSASLHCFLFELIMGRLLHYIPVRHYMMRQTNDCSSVWVMQQKVMCLQVDQALVQLCLKPRALINNYTIKGT